MPKLTNLKAGHWDESEARAYIQLAQWSAQRLRSITAESVGAIYIRSEERFGDSYLFTRYPSGQRGSLLLEASVTALAKPTLEPQDLVNLLHMIRRHPEMLTAMSISAYAPDAEYLVLEPNLSWLM